MKEYKVGIIGFGTVGAGVAENLLNNVEVIAKRSTPVQLLFHHRGAWKKPPFRWRRFHRFTAAAACAANPVSKGQSVPACW